MDLDEAVEECHTVARDNGWWERPRSRPELLALVHSEVSEALEALRDGDEAAYLRELIDVVIRVFDMLGYELDTYYKHRAPEFRRSVSEMLERKCEINRARPRKHGKLF